MDNNQNDQNRQEGGYSYQNPGMEQQGQQAYYAPPQGVMLPPELKKWNWGAFALNILWGIGHKVYLPLLCLVPLFNIVWVFICGAKGNKWLWESGRYQTPQELLKSQETWNRAGFVAFIIYLILLVLYIILVVIVGVATTTVMYDDAIYF